MDHISLLVYIMWLSLYVSINYHIRAHICYDFVTTSPHFAIKLIVYVLPIYCNQVKPLLVMFRCLLAFFWWLVFWTISVNFKYGLGCACIAANKNFGHLSITNNHNKFNSIIQLCFMEFYNSLQMVIWALLHLATNILTTENVFPTNYWLGQLLSIFFYLEMPSASQIYKQVGNL